MSQPSATINLEVEVDYGQIYIYAVSPWENNRSNDAVLRALDDAWHTHRFVGAADGVIDLVTPVQWNFHAPMRVEIWPEEPPSDDDSWDHVVDIDLDVPNGMLFFEGSGGGAPIPCAVPSGTYRAQVSGRGYDEAGRDRIEGMDSYRLRLWPRTESGLPTLRKSWPGWRNST
jgi:hypothetical protein